MKDLSHAVSIRKVVKGRDWEEILSRFHKSGLSIREFSAQEGIANSTLRDRLIPRKRAELPVSMPGFDSFIPLELSGASVEVELEFRGGTKLRIKG